MSSKTQIINDVTATTAATITTITAAMSSTSNNNNNNKSNNNINIGNTNNNNGNNGSCSNHTEQPQTKRQKIEKVKAKHSKTTTTTILNKSLSQQQLHQPSPSIETGELLLAIDANGSKHINGSKHPLSSTSSSLSSSANSISSTIPSSSSNTSSPTSTPSSSRATSFSHLLNVQNLVNKILPPSLPAAVLEAKLTASSSLPLQSQTKSLERKATVERRGNSNNNNNGTTNTSNSSNNNAICTASLSSSSSTPSATSSSCETSADEVDRIIVDRQTDQLRQTIIVNVTKLTAATAVASDAHAHTQQPQSLFADAEWIAATQDMREFEESLTKQCLCGVSERTLRKPFQSHYSIDANGHNRIANLSEWPTSKLLQFLSNLQLLFDIYLKQNSKGFICARIMDVCDALIRNDKNLIDQIIVLAAYRNSYVQFLAGRVLAAFLVIAKQEMDDDWLKKLVDNLFNFDRLDHVAVQKIHFSLEIIKRILEWKDVDLHPLEDEIAVETHHTNHFANGDGDGDGGDFDIREATAGSTATATLNAGIPAANHAFLHLHPQQPTLETNYFAVHFQESDETASASVHARSQQRHNNQIVDYNDDDDEEDIDDDQHHHDEDSHGYLDDHGDHYGYNDDDDSDVHNDNQRLPRRHTNSSHIQYQFNHHHPQQMQQQHFNETSLHAMSTTTTNYTSHHNLLNSHNGPLISSYHVTQANHHHTASINHNFSNSTSTTSTGATATNVHPYLDGLTQYPTTNTINANSSASSSATPSLSVGCHIITLTDSESFDTTHLKCITIKILENKWPALVKNMSAMIANHLDIENAENCILNFLQLWENIISVKANLSIVETRPFYAQLDKFEFLLNQNLSCIIYKQMLCLFNEALCYGSTLALQDMLPDETCLLAHQIVRHVKESRILESLPRRQPENIVSLIGFKRKPITYSDATSLGLGPLGSSTRHEIDEGHQYTTSRMNTAASARTTSVGGGLFSGSGDSDVIEMDKTILQKMVLLVLKSIAVTVKEIRSDSSDSSIDSTDYDAFQDMVLIERSIRDVLRKLESFIKHTLEFHPECHFSKILIHLFDDQDDHLIEAMVCTLDVTAGISFRNNAFPELVAMLNPVYTFLEFLKMISNSSDLLLDLLVSNETCFLLYLLRFLKYIRMNWTMFVQSCHDFGMGVTILDEAMSVLIRLRLQISRLVSRQLYPYDISPVLRLLESCESLYEGNELS